MSVRKIFKDKLTFLTSSSAKIDDLVSLTNRYLFKSIKNYILSRSNLFNITINALREHTNFIFLYITNALRETNIYTAQNAGSVAALAKAFSGYESTRIISARGVVGFKPLDTLKDKTNKLIIKDGAELVCRENGLIYTLLLDDDHKSMPATAIQFEFIAAEGVWKNKEYTADGSEFYQIFLDDTQMIENYEFKVYVDGMLYSRCDSLQDMTQDRACYMLSNGYDTQATITFGSKTKGVYLASGAIIQVHYFASNGTGGNISPSSSFKAKTGFFDRNGNEIDVTEHIKIFNISGFDLGSDPESTKRVRLNAGINSRALVFAHPDNLKSYLSRLSLLSYIKCWTTENEPNIFKVLTLPNIQQKIKDSLDYYDVPTEDITLSDSHKASIENMIANSRRNAVTKEIQFVDPTLKKYVVYVYIGGDIYDNDAFRKKIESTIADFMITNIHSADSYETSALLSNSELENDIYDLEEVDRVNLSFLSQENEEAKIRGYYTETTTTTQGAVVVETDKTVTVEDGTDPRLGFTDLGDIIISDNSVPIVRGGFDKYESTGNITLDKAVYVFVKSELNGNWEEI